MKRLTTAFLLLFLTQSLIFAQSISIEERTSMADMVIEGKVIQQESFWDSSHSRIYTRNIVEVSKIFKGNSDLEQIGIITKGGVVENEFQTVSHTFQTQINTEGVFFLRNAQQLNTSDFWVRGIESPLIKYIPSNQKFLAVDGTERYSNPQQDIYAKIEITTEASFVKKRNNSLETQLDKWLSENIAVKTVDDTDILIEFDFDNVALSGTEHVEFDIVIRTNEEGIKFAASDVYVQYSTDAFGNNVVENERIEASKEDVIENDVYTLQLTDETEQILKFLVNSGLESEELYPLNTFFEKFIHVKLKIEDLWQLANLSFDDFLMGNQSVFFDENTGEYVSFDRVSTAEPLFPFMVPTITSISPLPVTAGTSSYITIEGQNFGPRNADSRVLYKNASWFPGSSLPEWTSAYLTDETTEWSENQITVLVAALTQDLNSAGGGNVIVENSFGADTSATVIDVRYNINNIRLSNLNFENEYRVDMRRQTQAIPNTDFGLTWSISKELADKNELVVPIINHAVEQWRCATKIAWNVRDSTVTNNSENNSDFLNLIYSAPSSDFSQPNFLAETFTTGRIAECGTDLIFFVNEVDIAIKDSTNAFGLDIFGYALNSDPIQLNEKDFYATILHELGHAHMLNHAKPFGKVMYPVIFSGSTSGRELTIEDINGGIDVLQNSEATLIPSNQCPPSMLRYDCSTGTDEQQKFLELEVFPNPFGNELNVKFDATENGNAKIILFNVLGQQIVNKNYQVRSGLNEFVIHTNNLVYEGSYFLKIELGKEFFVVKLLNL